MANQRLWAPWRLEYIKATKTQGCIFCQKPALGDDEAALIPHRGERCFVMLNAFPYNNGHLMVAPYEHTGSFEELEPDTACELVGLAQLALRALGAAYGPEGYNLGLNQGKIAGAGVEDHVHLHVVPRWAGDTSFISAVGDTRVLPEALPDTLRSLREAFARVVAQGAEDRG